ncbi:hypothetical protein BJX63DRAFT_127760 [Aspergillus granulosus]|uniref:Uncharacterized protein n=1 Tax=Aspergillus granulosus TaxID=176169 RepID=A0ABR4HN07_9EURO
MHRRKGHRKYLIWLRIGDNGPETTSASHQAAEENSSLNYMFPSADPRGGLSLGKIKTTAAEGGIQRCEMQSHLRRRVTSSCFFFQFPPVYSCSFNYFITPRSCIPSHESGSLFSDKQRADHASFVSAAFLQATWSGGFVRRAACNARRQHHWYFRAPGV